MLNRREQPAWAAERSSSTIPVFRSTRLNTSPGASFLIFSPTMKARRASESFGNGRLSVKRNRRKERKGKGASGGNAGWQQSTGLLHFIVRVPFVENTKRCILDGIRRNRTFPFHPHPYGARLERKRTLPRAKNSPPDCFYGSCAAAALSSPAWRIKNGVSLKGYTVFGTPEGTRTPNPRNRNPMLYPLSHWRISESPIIIAGFPGFVKRD